MKNHFKKVEIKNFKSIRNLSFDCKKINVFIGEPNVGKSNVLEALSLLGVHYCHSNDNNKFLEEFIRYNEITNLFYDDDYLNKIEVNTDLISAYVNYQANNINKAELAVFPSSRKTDIKSVLTNNIPISIKESEIQALNQAYSREKDLVESLYIPISPNGQVNTNNLSTSTNNPVRKYHFEKYTSFQNRYPEYLLPPNGDNLFVIIDHDKELRSELVDIFKHYGLQFVANKKESTFKLQKNIDGYIYDYHYNSIADTLQRLMFYFSVIDSNKEAVLILEEPEVHSFPPYVNQLASRISADETNQYFLTTHSPYLLYNLIENVAFSNLNLFVTYFEDYETKIKRLSDEQIQAILDDKTEVFFNLSRYYNTTNE